LERLFPKIVMITKRIIKIFLISSLIVILGWNAFDSMIYQAFLPKEVQFFKMDVVGNLDWSPTGTFITGEGFTKDRGFVFLWPIGSSSFQVISEYDYSGIEIDPTLNPDGNMIAYLSFEDMGIVILNLNTTVKNVLPSWDEHAWFDNERLLFETYDQAISYYDFESKETFELYDFSPSREIWRMELSPDRNWVAVFVFTNNEDDPSDFILLSIENSIEHKILIDEFWDLIGWTPDSQWVIYKEKGALTNIYAINILELCRSERLDLSIIHTKSVQSIVWSPVDDRVAIAGRLGNDQGIFIIEDEAFLEWPSIDQCTPIEFEG
jgi:WD40 repeat protein